MTDDEFDSPDEWQQLADRCLATLNAANLSCTLQEEGPLDGVELRVWECFHEYERALPIYYFQFPAAQNVHIALCATWPRERRLNFALPAYPALAPYFDEVREALALDINDARLVGIVNLQDDPGYVFIEPHDAEAKMSELLHPIMLDVEGFDRFSRKLHFDCEDPALAQDVLTPDFFRLVAALGDVTLEINDGTLLVMYKAPINDEQTTALGAFVQEFSVGTNPDAH